MINKRFIHQMSSFGHETKNLLLTHTPKSEKLVILFPGGEGTSETPLLHYCRKTALLSNCDVLSLEYGLYRAPDETKEIYIDQIIKEALEVFKKLLILYKDIYFISKSLGTIIAGEISKLIGYHKVHNLFLTPLEATIPHLQASQCTVIVGNRDQYFTIDDINKISQCNNDVHIIEKAVHSLEIEDDVYESLKILGIVSRKVEKFVSN